MGSISPAVVFAAAWAGIVVLCCAFRICGRRATDCVCCDWFPWSICDCWGRERSRRVDLNTYLQQPPQSQLPPIVIVNKSDDSPSGDEDEDDTRSKSVSLLLSSSKRADPNKQDPVVVV